MFGLALTVNHADGQVFPETRWPYLSTCAVNLYVCVYIYVYVCIYLYIYIYWPDAARS